MINDDDDDDDDDQLLVGMDVTFLCFCFWFFVCSIFIATFPSFFVLGSIPGWGWVHLLGSFSHSDVFSDVVGFKMGPSRVAYGIDRGRRVSLDL
jgi:hypothetical protein